MRVRSCRLLLGLLVSTVAGAADHAESPAADIDRAADIADIFVFRAPDATGRIVAALTFGGRPAPRARIDIDYCDRDVLYVVHVDRDADDLPDLDILLRYGRDTQGQCGLRLQNVPGAGAVAFEGPTETVFTSPSGLRAFSGLRDDPFFFDPQGLGQTLMTFSGDPERPTGELRFLASRNGFGGRNITAAVFEMDEAVLRQGVTGPRLRFWATTARFQE
jgi:hypothetical protein